MILASIPEILTALLTSGRHFRVLFSMRGVTDEEASADVRARWPDFLAIDFGDVERVRDVVVDAGVLYFTAPFYSTLGRSVSLALKLERIISIEAMPVDHVPTEPKGRDRKGLRLV